MAKKRRRKRKQKKFVVKKKMVIILGVMIIIAAIIAVIFLTKDYGADIDGTVVNMPAENLQTNDENSSQENDAGDWYNLPGYINGAEKDAEQVICGMTLPYHVQDTPIVIEGIGQYTGPFVEDGNDEPVANALAIVVRNDSETDVEYAEIKLSASDGEEVDFHIATLPAGKSAVVLEQNKREFNGSETLTFSDKLYAAAEEMSLMEDEVEVTAEDGVLTLKNLTDNPLGTVYVRYKNKLNEDYYLGGITYSCKFEEVSAGESVEAQTKHFTVDGSTVLMVKAIEE